MRLTIDSTDDLDRVLAAVGGMFGVEVKVVPETTKDATRAEQMTSAKPPRSELEPAEGLGIEKDGAAGRRTTGRPKAARGRPGAMSKSRSRAGTPSTAQVRQWAREAGMQVSERGRVATAVLEAYRAAH